VTHLILVAAATGRVLERRMLLGGDVELVLDPDGDAVTARVPLAALDVEDGPSVAAAMAIDLTHQYEGIDAGRDRWVPRPNATSEARAQVLQELISALLPAAGTDVGGLALVTGQYPGGEALRVVHVPPARPGLLGLLHDELRMRFGPDSGLRPAIVGVGDA
jgi:hypothetical protein